MKISLKRLNKGAIIFFIGVFTIGLIFQGVFSGPKPTSAAEASKFKTGDRVAVTVQSLRVRSTASIKAPVAGSQRSQTQGTIIDGPVNTNGYKWWKINYDTGADGWSADKYLQLVAPKVLGISKSFAPVASKFKKDDRIFVSSQYAAVGAQPTTKSASAASQPKNAKGTVSAGPQSGNGLNWWQVNYDTGVDGWSVEKYLSRYIAPSSKPATTTNSGSSSNSGSGSSGSGSGATSGSGSSSGSAGTSSGSSAGSTSGSGSGATSGSGTGSTHSNPTPPVATSTVGSLTQVAGWRTSDYGTEDPTAVAQKDSAYYVSVAQKMATKFNSRPGGIYTVGYIETNTTMLPNELRAAASSITGVNIDSAGTQASPETMLTAFDAAGMDIILAVEPGKADVVQLATAILNKYKNHPSVKGFGVDNEWYMSEGNTMSSATAIALKNAVTAVNPNYKTIIKHYDSAKLPKGIAGITYLTDSCGFSSKTAAINDYVDWANTFSGSEIGYQFGYDKQECGTDDSLWWKPMGTGGEPALELTRAIKAKAPSANIYSVYWADFTILTQFPK